VDRTVSNDREIDMLSIIEKYAEMNCSSNKNLDFHLKLNTVITNVRLCFSPVNLIWKIADAEELSTKAKASNLFDKLFINL
jgi:hypothetical protein